MAVSEKVLSVSTIWSQWINRIWKGKIDILERYLWCFTDRRHSENWAKIHHFLPTAENWRKKKINWRKFSMGGSLKFWLTNLGNLYWKESTSIFNDRLRGKFPKIACTFWWWVRNKVRLTPESRYSAEGVDGPTTRPVLSCLPGPCQTRHLFLVFHSLRLLEGSWPSFQPRPTFGKLGISWWMCEVLAGLPTTSPQYWSKVPLRSEPPWRNFRKLTQYSRVNQNQLCFSMWRLMEDPIS